MTNWKFEMSGDSIEDSHDLSIATHAQEMFSKICDARDSIRSRLKYPEDCKMTEDKFLEVLRDILYLEWDD